MNDFTKYELEKILTWGYAYTEFGNSWVFKINGTLIMKIQSMIDNYCEHSEHHYYEDIAAAECKQCGMVMLP